MGRDPVQRSSLLDGNISDAGEQKSIKNKILSLLTAVSNRGANRNLLWGEVTC